MGSIEEPQGTFYLDGYTLCHIFHKEQTQEDWNSLDDHCEET